MGGCCFAGTGETGSSSGGASGSSTTGAASSSGSTISSRSSSAASSGSSSGGLSSTPSSGGSSGGTPLPCPSSVQPASPCADGDTCVFTPSSFCEASQPQADCEPAGSAPADGGACSAIADTSTPDLLCPQCEICSPKASTYPLGDCRPYVVAHADQVSGACEAWAGPAGLPPPGLQPAAVVIGQGNQEADLDGHNRAVYPLDDDAGCAIGYGPALFLFCSGPTLGIKDCLAAAGPSIEVCGCPAQCHYGHCVLACNSDGSCPDAGVTTSCYDGYCYQTCQTSVDCTASAVSYSCANGLCMNPDAGP